MIIYNREPDYMTMQLNTIYSLYGFLQVAVVGKFSGKLQELTDGSK